MLRAPSFDAIRILKIADNAIAYSLGNTTMQALWLPTSRETKYKAKQAVDSFCVRAGDVLQAGIVYTGELTALTVGAFAALNVAFACAWLAVQYGEWRVLVDATSTDDIINKVKPFYRRIDGAMVQANRSGGAAPLHTTLTATVGGGRDLFFALVGHSRAYLLRDASLMQLTRDHTHMIRRDAVRAPLVDLTRSASDQHHILTDALGAGVIDPAIDIERLTLADRDVVMLCTNGLTDVVGDQTIAEILASNRPVG